MPPAHTCGWGVGSDFDRRRENRLRFQHGPRQRQQQRHHAGGAGDILRVINNALGGATKVPASVTTAPGATPVASGLMLSPMPGAALSMARGLIATSSPLKAISAVRWSGVMMTQF